MIKNHLRLSVIIYFISTDTNNRMIKNHLQSYITENMSSENPASCYSIMSKVRKGSEKYEWRCGRVGIYDNNLDLMTKLYISR